MNRLKSITVGIVEAENHIGVYIYLFILKREGGKKVLLKEDQKIRTKQEEGNVSLVNMVEYKGMCFGITGIKIKVFARIPERNK